VLYIFKTASKIVRNKANTNIDKIKQGGQNDRPALFIIGK
jgi:hypothetical protein